MGDPVEMTMAGDTTVRKLKEEIASNKDRESFGQRAFCAPNTYDLYFKP